MAFPQPPAGMTFPKRDDYKQAAALRAKLWTWIHNARMSRALPALDIEFPAITSVGWGAWEVRARICLLISPLAGKIFAALASRPTRDESCSPSPPVPNALWISRPAFSYCTTGPKSCTTCSQTISSAVVVLSRTSRFIEVPRSSLTPPRGQNT